MAPKCHVKDAKEPRFAPFSVHFKKISNRFIGFISSLLPSYKPTKLILISFTALTQHPTNYCFGANYPQLSSNSLRLRGHELAPSNQLAPSKKATEIRGPASSGIFGMPCVWFLDFKAKSFDKSGDKWINEIGVSKNMLPQNGWFIIENPIKMEDLGVPLFSETPKCIWTQFFHGSALGLWPHQ